MARNSLTYLLCFGLAACVAEAEVIRVPGDRPTIQGGIDAARDGDIVVVADGVYTGEGNRDLNFKNKRITVLSGNGPSNCIIDCQAALTDPHRGFVFGSGETRDSVVNGFTIRNGFVSANGGAISCNHDSSPTIANCIITHNTAGFRGGAISCDNDSSPSIINCVITDNTAEYRGGGLYCDHASNPTMINCTFSRNTVDYRGAAVSCDHRSSPTLVNCTIRAGRGKWEGGLDAVIYLDHESALIITNCLVQSDERVRAGIILYGQSSATITNSTVSTATGARAGIVVSSGSSATITNSVLWGKAPLGFVVDSGSGVLTFCDVRGGWPGEGNIDTDPLWVSGLLGNHYLSQRRCGQDENSPCINAGKGRARKHGLENSTTCTGGKEDKRRVDMGYHYPSPRHPD